MTERICPIPFCQADFHRDGNVLACCPPDSYTPVLGNMFTQSFDQIWNGPLAQNIRRKLYEGKHHEVCKPTCPILSNGQLPWTMDYLRHAAQTGSHMMTPELAQEILQGKTQLSTLPTIVKLSDSAGCNIDCIMCAARGESRKHNPILADRMGKLLSRLLPGARHLTMCGMGDPFARPDTRDILINYDTQGTGLEIELITNGLLLPRYWDRIKHQRFASILVSSQPSKATYEKIFEGGHWEQLLECFEILRADPAIRAKVTLGLVVMRSNYREISKFMDLAESYGFGHSVWQIFGRWHENIFDPPDLKALAELQHALKIEPRPTHLSPVVFEPLKKIGVKLA